MRHEYTFRLLSELYAPLDQLRSTFSAGNALEPQPVVLGVQNTARNIRRVYPFVQERIRQEFGVELRMVGRSIEHEVTNASDLVSARKREH